MRTYFIAIRKDFILQKKIIFLLIPILSAASIFINYKLEGVVGQLMSFFLVELFGLHILFNSLSQLEDNEFGRNALVASPYCRKLFVLGRYMFLAFVFISIYILHNLVSFLTNLVGFCRFDHATIFIVGITLLFVSIWDSLNLTLYYKFGYSKMKIIGNLFIFSMPFILPQITKFLEKNIGLAFASDTNIIALIMIVLGIIVYFISYNLSVKLFSKRDL
ncbi:MAG: ABC-2 transporter permease [[Eubacterium] sulci]|jgi:ABC transporter permease protein|nr:ABC-2 transporter permease [[Eubacterium] sulci]